MTPDYITTEETPISNGSVSDKTLPAGSFVRPIRIDYVPKHIKDRYAFSDEYLYCYCFYGIIPIHKDKLRRV